ncbi:MAG: hypothetical protein JXA98_08525 [Methanosarcinaceae archaeon]|nr:hypothetical protein [Methanosarcinaceae archaeon]
MRMSAMMWLTTVVPIILLLFTGTSYALSDNEWDATTCILSYSNPSIDKDGYTIEVVDFDGYGGVNIRVYKDGIVTGSNILKNNDTKWTCIEEDEIEIKGLRITDKDKFPVFGNWPDDPKAELTIRIKKVQTSSRISVTIDVDDKEYLLDETVTASITVKNVGETKANNIRLNVGAEGLNIVDETKYKYVSIEDGSFKSENVRFKFPERLSDNMSISANVTCDDGDENIGACEEIRIKPPFKISKITTGSGSQDAKFYTIIGVTNVQKRTVHAVLADVLPMGFSIIDGSVTDDKHDLIWEFDIGPGEKKTFSYQSVTNRPAVYRVPTPHLKCNLCGQEYMAAPDYSTTITVLQSQIDNGYTRNKQPEDTSTDNPTTTPTATPSDNASSGGPDVNLMVNVLAAVSLEVTPGSLDFGTLAPGKTSPQQTLSLINGGVINATITVDVTDDANNLFVDGVSLNDGSWDQFDMMLNRKSECDVSAALAVPGTYAGVGNKKGTLIFWAEGCQ